MYKYNPQANNFIADAGEHANLTTLRARLTAAHIPYKETYAGIFIEDENLQDAENEASAIEAP